MRENLQNLFKAKNHLNVLLLDLTSLGSSRNTQETVIKLF